MTISLIKFNSKREVVNFLSKALEIEMGFESLAQWEAYVQAKNDSFRNMIFTMISESEHHASMVEEMIRRLGANPEDQYGLRKQIFDFSTREEQEMIYELAKTEKLALDTYTNIRSGLIAADITSWLPEEDREYIIERLDELIIDETRHVELASKQCGKVERIR